MLTASGDDDYVVVLPSRHHKEKRDSLTIKAALETVFQQMRICDGIFQLILFR